MAIGVVEAIYKLKYFIFFVNTKHGEWQELRETQGILSQSEHFKMVAI